MYYRHFGLDGPPFRFVPSATVLYLGTAHRECLAALEWALLHDQCGFMLLIGETGTGKTTLLNSVVARKVPSLHLACVTNPRLSFREIMRVVLPQLGSPADSRGKLELIQELEHLLANLPVGHRTAIAIDEAQDLNDENLEDLRLLANRIGAQDQLQIILMGHPELLDRLSAHNLRQLRERVSTKVTLLPLSNAESVAYIEYRLEAQGGSARIFEAQALRHLVTTAAGIPRRLNVLCHNSLVLACSKDESTVTLAVAREVVDDYMTLLGPSPAKTAQAPSSDEQRPTARNGEPAIRPRRRSMFVAGACAAVVVAAAGRLLIPTTQNWADEFNRAVPKIGGLVALANAEVSSKSSVDYETVAPESVVARPRRSGKSAPAPGRTTIQIHAGDTFHDLATRYLGSKDRTVDLIKANPQISDPNVLYVGEVVYLPSTRKNDQARVVQ